jgi:hypothetical protein
MESPVGAPALRSWLSRLGEPLDPTGVGDDADLIDQIGLLEQVKAACAARQARLAVAFEESQRAAQVALGVPASQVGRGIAEQVALARRESPTRGSRHLGLAKALVREMPHTLAALSGGQISEWTATIAVRETACLTAQDRRAVDEQLADRLATASPAQVRRQAWAAACRLDPAAAANRHAKAAAERRVSVRPAPDAMTYLTALLPVQDGVAAYAALTTAAGTAKAGGDPRSRGQIMADTLLDRLTAAGTTQTSTSGGPDQRVDVGAGAPASAVEVHLVITDTTLLAGGDQPALVTSTDTSTSNPAADLIPAQLARDLVRDAATAWVRRLYTSPQTGQLVAMESTRRLFDGQLRRMLILRDTTCRTPWCDAPIRHGDHITPNAQGGPTSYHNGQGLCERCNQTKNQPGWHASVLDDGRRGSPKAHTVRTTTPTGHSYDSTAPPLLSTQTDVAHPERLAG